MNSYVKYANLGLLLASSCTLANQQEQVWVSIDSSASQHFRLHNTIKGNNFSVLESNNPSVSLLNIPTFQIESLSGFMHDEYHRCGGFVAHDSLQEAHSYIEQLQNVNNNSSISVSYTIDSPQMVNTLISNVSSSNLTTTVNALSDFHNRYYSKQTGVDAAQWIKQTWSQISNERADISVNYYQHSWSQPSVVATIQGNEKPDEIVVIGGHLDSINSANASNGRAPGADDNASGIAVLTETLKALVASDFKPQRTIQIMGFAAEEVGLRGSKAIASDYKSQGKNVVGMVQFDMTGRNGSQDDIVMMTDFTTNAQNQFLGQLITTYIPDINFGFDQCGYGCSDHASWYQQGFAASIPFESRMSDINRQIHTVNDTFFDANHAIKFAKLSVAYLAELAKVKGNVPPPQDNVLENGVVKSGLNGSAKAQLFFTMEVPENSSNLQFQTNGGSGDADLYVKFGSKPSLQTYDCKSTTSTANETCTIADIQSGTYHVMVEAWNTINNVSLVGRFEQKGTDPDTPEPINREEGPLNVNQNQWIKFEQPLVAGYKRVTFTIAGGSGDADLYVKYLSDVSTSNYDCRPYKNGNNEVCSFEAPKSGTWYVGIRGYSNASGVTLSIITE